MPTSLTSRVGPSKRKGGQVRFTSEQSAALERRFSTHRYLSPEQRRALAATLKLTDRQVRLVIISASHASLIDEFREWIQIKIIGHYIVLRMLCKQNPVHTRSIDSPPFCQDLHHLKEHKKISFLCCSI
jgi:hypothetical protein